MKNIKTFCRMYLQLIAILKNSEKKQALFIALLSIISALLETMGVGVILPFVLAMLQPERLAEYGVVNSILNAFHITTKQGMIVLVGGGVIAIYVAKNSFILWFNYIRIKFRNDMEKSLGVLMLRSYIYRPYSFFLNANTGEITRGVIGDNMAVATVIDNYCAILNEMLTCIMLGIALLCINPIMAIVLLALAGGISSSIVVTLRKKIGKCALETREAFAKRLQYINEVIGGIKEIDVMHRHSEFVERFALASERASKYNTKYLWMASMPSRLVETVFISGLVILVLVAYGMLDDITVLIAQFSALAVAAVRILPSISNVANAMNSLVYQRPAFESAYDNIVATRDEKIIVEEENNGVGDHFNNEICIEDISWKYAAELDDVINGLSLSIKRGESIGFIGKSGAGKSTLADIILGLYKPQNGKVEVDGKSIYDKDTKWYKMIGYVPQTVFLLDDTVKNNILFGLDEECADEERLRKVIKQAQLSDMIDAMPDGIDTVLGDRGVKISGGQRQRIAIARALYYDPDILVMDEATSALDNDTEAAIIEAINSLQGEKTIIIVAHRLTTIEKCDKVYAIENGKAILQGK